MIRRLFGAFWQWLDDAPASLDTEHDRAEEAASMQRHPAGRGYARIDPCDLGTCDCIDDDNDMPIAYDLTPLARAVQIAELDSWWALPTREPAE